MENQLSNVQLQFLQRVSNNGHLLIVHLSERPVCEYLQANGYIELYELLTPDNPDEIINEHKLSLNSHALIVQLTENGKAYIDMHMSKKRTVRLELLISLAALLSSIILGVLGLVL